MISIEDLYGVLSAVVPLYVTMFLAYASVKWWNIFSPDQCSGINRFVAYFAVPLLSLDFISRIDPYKMDLLFVAADGISKVLILVVLLCWAKFWRRGSLEWVITLFSLSTLPNTLVMGIPLLKSMYGDDKEGLMIQVLVLQCIIWYSLLLFLFEYREARIGFLKNLTSAARSCLSSSTSPSNSVKSKGRDEVGSAGDHHEVVMAVAATTTSNQEVAHQKDSAGRLRPVVAAAMDGDGVLEQSVRACQKERGKENGVVEHEKNETLEEDTTVQTSTVAILKILKTVFHKLLRNPNSYASLVGLTWALISCRWGIQKPQIVDDSVTILSKAGLGLAMFSLGLFMALQPKIIACGKRMAIYGMIARFVAGPAVMAVASLGVGLKGTTLRLSIVQAALPQGIVPFVFAREYDLHPDVLSTAVIFGMIVSLPITILYYVFLGL
ncbi:hypothetical protein Tsubulata_016085 [Turnera subulata]|uniref:Auxin efflux carrier component n=1 Tax=Turnera subulata TaxID=218843 RepID=A0A9Q0J6L7_9ROSI|nr:hypothetical protein Tsubulata_016085 [Turnera subulata]